MQASTLVGVRVHRSREICRVAPSRVHSVLLDAIDFLWQNLEATKHLSGLDVHWEHLVPIVRPQGSPDEERVAREVLGIWSARLCG